MRRRTRLVALLCAGLFSFTGLASSARASTPSTSSPKPAVAAQAAPPAYPPCNGHPRDAQGFVTDGGPQCGMQWCIGTPAEQDACDAAMHNGFITTGRPQLDDAHCVGSPYQIGLCQAVLRGFQGWMQPRNGTEACIMSHEWHDYSRSPNPSHFGRYQFGGIWFTYGGQNDWGDASPAEQDRVFVQTVAASGYSPWVGYDGC